MSEVIVHNKEPDHLDELYIGNLSVPYLIIYNVGSNNETRADIHIKRDEAKALYKEIKNIFKINEAWRCV